MKKRGGTPPEPHIHPGSSNVPCGNPCISLRKRLGWDDVTIIQAMREPLLYDQASDTYGDPKPNSAQGVPVDQLSGYLLFGLRNALHFGSADQIWLPAGGNPCVDPCWCQVPQDAEGRFLSNEEEIVEKEFHYTEVLRGQYVPRPDLAYPPISQLTDTSTGAILEVDPSTDHVFLPAAPASPLSLERTVRVETRYKTRVRLKLVFSMFEFIGTCVEFPALD